ncbi:MAG: 16S rRNA (cytidine(1402)-2'-O)-methyltransferase [Pseudomonadota bacterium]|nr:MAG: 16S rRNA (cytidine(1402)-2'-O)-methyltransferase [Pseudomonadota bacterium]
MAGTLFLVATPIGNLGDVTLRALDTLRAVALVAAEDTRHTRALLTHFGIKKPLVAHDAHASDRDVERLLERLGAGEDVALVTDAGTPGVSDPGAKLVRAAHEAAIRVVPIPGVSAVTAAVAVSGLVDGPFVFLGFPPRQGRKRRAFFDRVFASEEPVILFEAPHRAERTLAELAEREPERRAVLCRELTKIHEDVRRGSLAELAANAADLRGEITLVVAGAPERARSLEAPSDLDELDGTIRTLLRAGETPRDIVATLATSAPLAKRDLYRRVAELAREERAESSEHE